MNNSIETQLLKLYRVIKPLADGPYTRLWVVKDRSFGTVHCLKKVSDAFRNNAQAQSIYRELTILAQCQHPNIVRLDRVFRATNENDLYLVMEYAQTNLQKLIKEDILKPVQKRFIIYQILSALKYIHSAEVVHGNLSTSHILVNNMCQIKLCDFGFAKSVQKNMSNTSAGNADEIIKRCYNAPETLLAEKYGKAADIWSLGCVIVQMLTGKPILQANDLHSQIIQIIELTGNPKQSQIQSMQKQTARQILNEHKGVQKKFPLKYINSELVPIAREMLQFNPNNRPRVQEILLSPIFREFRGIFDQPISKSPMELPLDKYGRVSSNEYRRVIYQDIKKRYVTIITDYERYIEEKYSSPQKSIANNSSRTSLHSSNTQKKLSNKQIGEKQNINVVRKVKKNNFTVFHYENYFVSSNHYKTHLKKEIQKISSFENNDRVSPKQLTVMRKYASSLKM